MAEIERRARELVRDLVPGGAGLPDPHGLLEGRGKVHRFVRIADAAELDRSELRELMRAQAAAR